MRSIQLNRAFVSHSKTIFAGDYEVVGPDPALGHDAVAGLGADMVLIHYHHRHEFSGGGNKGLWGTLCRNGDKPDWSELDRVVESANKRFSLVGLYPIGWAHMVEKVAERCGDEGVSKLTAGTFVELTRSSF